VRPVHGKLATGPDGLRGGGAGGTGGVWVNGAPSPDKTPVRMRAGDVMRLRVPGGGGMYPPGGRAPAALAADKEAGIVTPDGARAYVAGRE
jgi:N-methylhydantoinase B/oxoprolinase/acetone carboxylase alpha subunit